jgi:hypothetical protein
LRLELVSTDVSVPFGTGDCCESLCVVCASIAKNPIASENAWSFVTTVDVVSPVIETVTSTVVCVFQRYTRYVLPPSATDESLCGM